MKNPSHYLEELLKESKIIQSVSRLAQIHGQDVYLVGGALRDILLKQQLGKDFDFVCLGEVGHLASHLAHGEHGKAFPIAESEGTWRVVLSQEQRKTEVDFSQIQGKDIIHDLKQRDFTINSLAVNLKDVIISAHPTVIDPLHGLVDLQRRILRANSEESLRQDPLRMLRAFRLSSVLGLQLDPDTLQMIQRNKKEISRSAGERIRDELFALLNEEETSVFFRKLKQTGLLREIFPEIKNWENLEQGSHHDFPLLEHSIRTVEAVEICLRHIQEIFPPYGSYLEQHFCHVIEEGVSRRALLKFVAFFHDSGKPTTYSEEPEGKTLHFFKHAQEGKSMNEIISQRLKPSRKSIRLIAELTRYHMRLLGLVRVERLTIRAKYNFFRDLGQEGLDSIFLAFADGLASKKIDLAWPLSPEMEGPQKILKIARELLGYYFEDFIHQPLRPLLNGYEIMEALELPPGKEVGRLLTQLREAEIFGKIRTRQEALDFLKNIDRTKPFL